MADRSEVKVADEAFAYNSSITFLPIHLAESLISMNAELAKIDELLVDDGVESIYHINQEDNIDYSMEMLGELLAYSSDLAFYALELIDKPLYKNFNLNATESISRIKVEDYSTENTLGITYTTHASYGDTQNAKKTLSIEDFLGVTAPENGGNLSNIPKEFTDFSNQYVTMYENLKANLVDEDGNQITLEEYLDQLVSMGEFSHTKDQPFRQFLSAVLDITIILPLIEACTGTDYITDEDLSDFERGMKGVGAVVGAFSLGTSYVAMKGAGFATQEILMNMGKAVAIDAASTTTSYWTGYACNEMGLPLPLTLMLSMGVGMGTSYGLNRILIQDFPDIDIYHLDEEKKAQEDFIQEFASRREVWVDDEKAMQFIETSDIYAQKAVDSGACFSKEEFYKMYISRAYNYSDDFVEKVKIPYKESGASALVSRKDVINAFDNPRFHNTIGRQEHGNFVTSIKEDSALIYNSDGSLKSPESIVTIKGVDVGKYDNGIFQYAYDSEFVNNCDEMGLLRTVNGDNPGANSLNIPGCQTWAGKNVSYSESELIMPSVDVSGYNSNDVFSALRNNGVFEIKNPTVITADGGKVTVNGMFRVKILGE